MTKKKKILLSVISIIIILLAGIIIWFKIPYSPLKDDFDKDVEQIVSNNENDGKIFREEELEELPIAIKNYMKSCGYIGKPQMSFLNMEYRDVAFKQGINGPDLVIDYSQYDLVNEPCRIAFIDTSMFGVPFHGYDYYKDGVGGMKGVIAKSIVLFDTTGPEMDQACLATYLAECPLAPSSFFQDFISYEEINDHEVRATITYKGQSASGIYTFNDDYEYVSFYTEDRSVADDNGGFEYVPWSAECGDYKLAENGIKYPTTFKAIWHYPQGDLIYFDGKISSIS
ncbi:MAG: hypothetical protein J6U54_07545 [Clostridiales bacterium]|nr:hypothetical protein [Clostridiales bacterium]